MSEYLTDPRILWTLLVLAAIAAIAVLYLAMRKEKKSKEIVTSEWQPTGKIDFHCVDTPKDDKVPSAFLLRVEDFRTVESISGVEHVEIRWRNATLAEAKSVVVAHQNAADTGAKVYQFAKHRVSKSDQGGDHKLTVTPPQPPDEPPANSDSSNLSRCGQRPEP
jgi:hypothetical protein